MQLVDLRPDHLALVHEILHRFVPKAEVSVFGSRAKWLARETSDLDLCIREAEPLGFKRMGLLKEAFEESNLPYKVDVIDWATSSESFRKIIERDKVVVQKAGRGKSTEFQKTNLGKLITFTNGKSSPERFDNAKFSVFGSNGLIGKANESNAPSNSIVVGRVGSYCGAVHFSQQACWVTDNAIKATAKEDNDPSYLFYLLKHLNLNKWRSGSGQPLINQSTLNAIEVRVPLPLEQKAIGSFIGALDHRINLLRETNATLEAIAQALFKSWFVDFDPAHAKQQGRAPEGMDEATAALFPDSFEESELGLVPKGWRVGTVADLGEVICGKTPPTSNLKNYGDEVPFITIPDMHGYLVVTTTNRALSRLGADSQRKKYLPPGAICVSCIATPGLVVRVTTESQTNQQINSVVPLASWGKSFPLFLLRRIGDAVRAGGSGGSVFHNLSKSGFEELKVLLTNGVIAQKFDEVVEPLVVRIEANQRQAQTLATLRDTLLPRLISGQLRLPEAKAMIEEAT